MKIPGSHILKIGLKLCLFIAFPALTFCCIPSGGPGNEILRPPPPRVSLLGHDPLIGDETEIRDPRPQPERLELMMESVEGWRSPPERILRFDLDMRESARLSVRLGATTTVPVRFNDIDMRIVFIPDIKDENAGETEAILFETTPQILPQIFTDWYDLDIGIGEIPPGSGELIFECMGPLASDPGLSILWGSPAIYYPGERQGKNILLIGVDTLRRDAVGVYGGRSELTPTLNELAESGTVFNQVRAQSSWTLPSFASMITGDFPSKIGADIYTGYLPDKYDTIAEILRPYGWTTATICSNTWLGNPESGFQQGMDSLWYEYDASALESVNRARDFIETSKKSDWFCFLHFMDPHTPYAPPPELLSMVVDPDYDGPYGSIFNETYEWKSNEIPPDEADIRHVRNLYDGEVASLDIALGELFEYLEINELMDDTLIIFSSDHGEEFFEHGGFEHSHTQFDELVYMPLIISGPGFPAGIQVDALAANTDILPTILEYVNYPLPDLPGLPLQNLVNGDSPDERIIFGEGNARGTLRRFAVQWPYKCIVDFVTGEMQLYDLAADPGELTDISSYHPEIASNLTGEMTLAMMPSDTEFHLWITRGHGDVRHLFTGTISLPGGLDSVRGFRLEDDDWYEIDGSTIRFEILSGNDILGPNKHLLIIPSVGSDTLEITVEIDGETSGDRFFPYGTYDFEPTYHATVSLDDFPLGADLPLTEEERPAVCYLWGSRGFTSADRAAHSEETLEQLRSLGYIN